jgi:hypothetical protein
MRKLGMIGKTFDRWTVVSEADKRGRLHLYWNCVCKCGATKEVLGSDLRRGRSRSCSCIRVEIAAPYLKPTPKAKLVGQRFGRLLVTGEADSVRLPCGTFVTRFFVRCDCGVEKIVQRSGLSNGDTKSCGCWLTEVRRRPKKHGEIMVGKPTAEYTAWQGMKQRCNNPNDKKFKHYGGRGITVCARWLDSYQNFLADMGRRPSADHSIDRYPDNDGNYEPNNCRWATPSEQNFNKRPYSQTKAA